jgi:hypothetical protein
MDIDDDVDVVKYIQCAYQLSINLKSLFTYCKGSTLCCQIILSGYCIVQCDCEFNN